MAKIQKEKLQDLNLQQNIKATLMKSTDICTYCSTALALFYDCPDSLALILTWNGSDEKMQHHCGCVCKDWREAKGDLCSSHQSRITGEGRKVSITEGCSYSITQLWLAHSSSQHPFPHLWLVTQELCTHVPPIQRFFSQCSKRHQLEAASFHKFLQLPSSLLCMHDHDTYQNLVPLVWITSQRQAAVHLYIFSCYYNGLSLNRA